MAAASRLARSTMIADRFRAPPRERLLEREVDVLGRRALLTIERVAAGELRASVAVRGAGGYLQTWTLGRAVQDEAHCIAREAVEELGARAVAAGAWGVAFTIDATEG